MFSILKSTKFSIRSIISTLFLKGSIVSTQAHTNNNIHKCPNRTIVSTQIFPNIHTFSQRKHRIHNNFRTLINIECSPLAISEYTRANLIYHVNKMIKKGFGKLISKNTVNRSKVSTWVLWFV